MHSTHRDRSDSLRVAHAVDALCDRFEDALRRGLAGPLDGWLPADAAVRAAALVELTRLEFDHRLRRGEDARAEDYFNRYPELRADAGGAARLLAAERQGRRIGATAPGPTAIDDRPCPVGALPEVGTVLGDFELLSVLGAGAFGRVFLARQVSLGRQVALKVTANWGNEARTQARLEHDHIVQVFAEVVDPARDLRLLCMQYIPGTTLERVIAALRGRPRAEWSGSAILEVIDAVSTAPTALDPAALRDREFLAGCDFVEAACWLAAKVAEALAHAHGLGVLHRDVKPANILLSRYGRPYLADFNVAAAARPDEDAGNGFGGTPAYMAPEHLEAFAAAADSSAVVGERADVYSLGVVLYELLVGQLPFELPPAGSGRKSAVLAALLAGRRQGAPPLPREAAIPEVVARLVQRCLEPDPQRRYENAAELARALEGCRELRRVERELPPPGPLTTLFQRWPVGVGLALVLLPHLLGSVVNVSYNGLRIADRLTAAQQETFVRLVLAYNAFAYPACLLLSLALVGPVWSVWRRLQRSEPLRTEAVTAARRRARQLPLWAILVSSLGWLPGGLLFPLGLCCLTPDPVTPAVFGHFLISFTLSGLIALTYSFLALQFLTLRVLYPQLWVEAADLRAIARAELRGVARRLSFLQFWAVLIPLAGALLMIGVGPETSAGGDSLTFRVLVTALIVLGMTGLGVTILATSLLQRTLAVLVGRERG